MKTSIYYFTGTGNSLYAAKHLSKAIENSEVLPIPKALNGNKLETEADRVGIVFPLYCGGLPEIVFRFIKKLNIKKDAYVFAVATRGGSGGHVMMQIDNLLKEKNRGLNANYFLTMPSNYVRMYGMKDEEKMKEIIDKADNELDKISKAINNKENNKINKTPSAYLMGLFYKGFLSHVHKQDSNFYADDRCNNCGTCEKVCPVSNVKLVDGKPQWNHNCQDCMACIQLCPAKSIQAGKKTIKRRRYSNPYVSVQEIMEQK